MDRRSFHRAGVAAGAGLFTAAAGGRAYPAQEYGAQAYGPQTYEAQGYPAAAYAVPTYETQGYETRGYETQGYGAHGYPAPAYMVPAYPAPTHAAPAYVVPPRTAPYGAVLSDGLAVPWTLRQVVAGDLNVCYAECGPPDGPVVVCLHGWPYDIHSFAEAAPLLAARGYRVLVPYLRATAGPGSAPSRSRATPNRPPSLGTWSPCWTRSGSAAPCWPGSTGAPGRPRSSPRCGPTGSRPWCRWAAT